MSELTGRFFKFMLFELYLLMVASFHQAVAIFFEFNGQKLHNKATFLVLLINYNLHILQSALVVHIGAHFITALKFSVLPWLPNLPKNKKVEESFLDYIVRFKHVRFKQDF